MRNWMKTMAVPAVLVAVLVFGMLVADVAPAFAQEVITLRVLNYRDNTAPGGQREQTEIWDKFAELYPNIKLEIEELFLEPFHQKTEAYAAANQLPDVIYAWPGGRSTTLHRNGLLKDLTPLLGEAINEFSPAAVVPQAGGYLGVLPIGLSSTHVMFANKAMLDELGLSIPATYEELVAMVPTIKAAGKEVILMGAEDDWVVQSVFFSTILGRMAGDEFLDNVVEGTANFTDEPFVDALRFYRKLYDDGVLSFTNLLTPYGEADALFAAGRAPFLIDGDWRTGNFLTNPSTGEALIPVDEQHNYVLTIFPAIPGEVVADSYSGTVSPGFGINAAIPAGSAREQAAWTLVEFLTGVHAQTVRLETGAASPSRIGITSDNLEPLAQTRVEYYGNHSAVTYVIDSVLEADVYNPINIGLQEIGLGFSTPEQVAAEAQRALEAWRAAR